MHKKNIRCSLRLNAKIGVYIARQNKKFTWLQACILGNVGVIWCNNLGDSHFQTYVMNLIELWLITIYLSPHMYLKFLLVAHITQVTLC